MDIYYNLGLYVLHFIDPEYLQDINVDMVFVFVLGKFIYDSYVIHCESIAISS